MRSFIRVQLCVAALLMLSCQAARGSDQTVVISTPPMVCSAAVAATLTPDLAKAAIEQVVGPGKIDPGTYYIIHDVTYNPDFSIEQQHWYVYYSDWDRKPSLWDSLLDPRFSKHFEESRIFGSTKVAVIYFHNNVLGLGQDAAIVQATANVPAAAGVVGAQRDQYVRDLLFKKVIGGDPTAGGDPTSPAAASDLVNAANQTTLVGVKGGVIDSSFGPLASLSYKIDITKKVPAPIQDLQGIAKIAFAGHAAGIKVPIQLQTVSICGGKAFIVTPLPSDMTVSAQVTAGTKTNPSTKELGKNTFDNEKKYRYDFSFALPLKSFNDLTVNSSDLTLTAKKVEKQNLFAVFDLSPVPYDTKKASFQLVPVLLYGVPITGKPLNHHLLAGAVGLNKVQFFAGVIFNHDRDLTSVPAPPPGTSTGTATGAGPIRDRWVTQFTYGINFPVSAITEMLKKK